ncbi:hypothetical protein [Photobacterium leiognathi]|nr:hypothetical protein [Photobacterium leiognathi]
MPGNGSPISSAGSGSFSPFFFDWGGYYNQGLIDAAEWKANRFRLI